MIRGWEPWQASGEWGKDYEHWVFPGSLAADNASILARVDEGRPSRLDVAFDFPDVPWRPSDVRREFSEAVAAGGRREEWLEGTAGGEETGQTWAVGSVKTKTRRVVVYEKGRERRQKGLTLFPDEYHPERWQRVELRVYGDVAADLWAAWKRDPEEAWAIARWHVAQVIPGLDLGEGREPARVPPAALDGMASLVTLFDQYSESIVVADEQGVNVVGVARAVRDMRQPSRMTRWRSGQRWKSLPTGEDLGQLIIRMLEARLGVVSTQAVYADRV